MTGDAPRSAHPSTPLARRLAERIARDGPIPVASFMSACLADPEHGYYHRADTIGRAGDFITAPEISQMFGELIGIWTAAVWQQLGAPARWRLVEMGPGRGTLMADLLRALKVVPHGLTGLHVELVDISAPLIATQRQRLREQSVPVTWHGALTPSELPTVIIANELLDALPVRQLVATSGRWHERLVDVDANGDLRLVVGPAIGGNVVPLPPVSGSIFETRDGFADLLRPIAEQSHRAPLAGLFIDYGHEGPCAGETLQAVRGHHHIPVLAASGEADLSAHVDFADFLAGARALGLAGHGPMPQAAFLLGLGLTERLHRLMAGAGPALANRLELDAARLVAPDGMGARFLAAAITSPGLAPPPFAPPVARKPIA